MIKSDQNPNKLNSKMKNQECRSRNSGKDYTFYLRYSRFGSSFVIVPDVNNYKKKTHWKYLERKMAYFLSNDVTLGGLEKENDYRVSMRFCHLHKGWEYSNPSVYHEIDDFSKDIEDTSHEEVATNETVEHNIREHTEHTDTEDEVTDINIDNKIEVLTDDLESTNESEGQLAIKEIEEIEEFHEKSHVRMKNIKPKNVREKVLVEVYENSENELKNLMKRYKMKLLELESMKGDVSKGRKRKKERLKLSGQ